MELSKEIIEAHGKLSDCSVKFLEFVKANPGSLTRANFDTLLSESEFDYFQSQPWPTFINKKTKQEIVEAASGVYRLITEIPGRLFDYDYEQISRFYQVPRDDVEWIFDGSGKASLPHLWSRGDFVISPGSGLKCLEFNVATVLGGWELDFLEPLYTGTPVMKEFLERHRVRLRPNCFFRILLEQMVERALERLGGSPAGGLNIAIISSEYNGFNRRGMVNRFNHLYKTFLQQQYPALKGEILWGDFDRLRLLGNHLLMGDKPIRILIEMCSGEVSAEVKAAVKYGKLILYNGPVTDLMSHKLNLALLSEYQASDLFSPGEREIIRKYIPWTRKIVPGETTYEGEAVVLEDFIISHREHLVIKPSRGHGGIDVVLGCHTSPGQWKQQVGHAFLKKNWVVQDYALSSPYLYQAGEQGYAVHHAVWGFFLLGSRYAGGFVRILPENHQAGIINSSQGAEESIILEVEE